MPCEAFVEPVRLMAPSLSPVSPGSGEIGTTNPFSNYRFTVSTGRRISTTFQGF